MLFQRQRSANIQKAHQKPIVATQSAPKSHNFSTQKRPQKASRSLLKTYFQDDPSTESLQSVAPEVTRSNVKHTARRWFTLKVSDLL